MKLIKGDILNLYGYEYTVVKAGVRKTTVKHEASESAFEWNTATVMTDLTDAESPIHLIQADCELLHIGDLIFTCKGDDLKMYRFDGCIGQIYIRAKDAKGNVVKRNKKGIWVMKGLYILRRKPDYVVGQAVKVDMLDNTYQVVNKVNSDTYEVQLYGCYTFKTMHVPAISLSECEPGLEIGSFVKVCFDSPAYKNKIFKVSGISDSLVFLENPESGEVEYSYSAYVQVLTKDEYAEYCNGLEVIKKQEIEKNRAARAERKKKRLTEIFAIGTPVMHMGYGYIVRVTGFDGSMVSYEPDSGFYSSSPYANFRPLKDHELQAWNARQDKRAYVKNDKEVKKALKKYSHFCILSAGTDISSELSKGGFIVGEIVTHGGELFKVVGFASFMDYAILEGEIKGKTVLRCVGLSDIKTARNFTVKPVTIATAPEPSKVNAECSDKGIKVNQIVLHLGRPCIVVDILSTTRLKLQRLSHLSQGAEAHFGDNIPNVKTVSIGEITDKQDKQSPKVGSLIRSYYKKGTFLIKSINGNFCNVHEVNGELVVDSCYSVMKVSEVEVIMPNVPVEPKQDPEPEVKHTFEPGDVIEYDGDESVYTVTKVTPKVLSLFRHMDSRHGIIGGLTLAKLVRKAFKKGDKVYVPHRKVHFYFENYGSGYSRVYVSSEHGSRIGMCVSRVFPSVEESKPEEPVKTDMARQDATKNIFINGLYVGKSDKAELTRDSIKIEVEPEIASLHFGENGSEMSERGEDTIPKFTNFIARDVNSLFSKGGVQKDDGKLDWSLVDFDSLDEMVKVMQANIGKYDRDNWKKGLNVSRIYNSMIRHLNALKRGEEIEPEDGLHHVGHIMTRAMFLAFMYKFKREFVDFPKQK